MCDNCDRRAAIAVAGIGLHLGKHIIFLFSWLVLFGHYFHPAEVVFLCGVLSGLLMDVCHRVSNKSVTSSPSPRQDRQTDRSRDRHTPLFKCSHGTL
jgi:hypothetical protein